MPNPLDLLDLDLTKTDLSKHYLEAGEDKSKLWRQLKTYASPEQIACTMRISDTGIPKAHRLCFFDDTENVEVVLDIRGVLVRHDLPPVTTPSKIPKNLFAARQTVEISGLGLEDFAICEEALRQIDNTFQGSLREGSYEPLQINEVEGYPYTAIALSNRYFTPTFSVPSNAVAVDFPDNVDPIKHLAKVGNTKSKFIHLEDNVVGYYARRPAIKDKKMIKSYYPTDPACFRVGQVVEAQISFMLVPTNVGKSKLHLTLRSLAILSDPHYLRTKPTGKVGSRQLKRSVGYGGCEEEGAVRRIRMGLGDLILSEPEHSGENTENDM